VNALLKLTGLIDRLNHRVGRMVMWLVLAAVVMSAGNAIVRKIFGTSSNALLEIQWYLFAAVFTLGAAYAFLENAHVRIDFVSSRLSAKARNVIDIVGIIVFLLPFCYLVLTLSWPLTIQAYQSGEMSQNAGGLIRWPVYAVLPIGIALLVLQSFSELVKRVAFLTGAGPDALAHGGHDKEEELAKEIAAHETLEQKKLESK
jgi:TRAP-type mannitol/chloroaromatic compound transport system permease small subunit